MLGPSMLVPTPPSEGPRRPPAHAVRSRAASEAPPVLRSPLTLFVLCVGTFLASGLLLGTGELHASLAFWSSKAPRLWHLLLSFQPALWVTSVAVVWPEFSKARRSVWPSSGSRLRPGLVLCTVLMVLVACIPLLIQTLTNQAMLPANAEQTLAMPGFRFKLVAIGVVGVLVAAVHAFGILCVHAQLIDWRRRSAPGETVCSPSRLEKDTRRFLQLRSQVRLFLGFAATIIGIATLSTGALREVVNEGALTSADRFPASLAMAYGLHFSALLAAVYLPAQFTLNSIGELLAERLVTQSLGKRARWKEWTDEQRAVRTYLGLEDNALDVLRDGIAMLAPLMASLSSLLLSHG